LRPFTLAIRVKDHLYIYKQCVALLSHWVTLAYLLALPNDLYSDSDSVDTVTGSLLHVSDAILSISDAIDVEHSIIQDSCQ
jgi:hypothetical protein